MRHSGLRRPGRRRPPAAVAQSGEGGSESLDRRPLARTRFAFRGAWPRAAAVGGGASVRRPRGRRGGAAGGAAGRGAMGNLFGRKKQSRVTEQDKAVLVRAGPRGDGGGQRAGAARPPGGPAAPPGGLLAAGGGRPGRGRDGAAGSGRRGESRGVAAAPGLRASARCGGQAPRPGRGAGPAGWSGAPEPRSPGAPWERRAASPAHGGPRCGRAAPADPGRPRGPRRPRAAPADPRCPAAHSVSAARTQDGLGRATRGKRREGWPRTAAPRTLARAPAGPASV